MIAKRYIHTWFVLDLLSTFPFDHIVGNNSARGAAMLRILRFTKLMKVLRVLKVTRLKTVVHNLLSRLNPVWLLIGTKVVTFLLIFILFTHWMACAFCALPWIIA